MQDKKEPSTNYKPREMHLPVALKTISMFQKH